MLKHLNKNNLHHAYLIEGQHKEIMPEILKFLESLGISTNANPDFMHISLDSFKIEDARNLKSYSAEKGFSRETGKKIFVVSANSFLVEAQNSLLKMFEEPIENTHFFLIVPDTNSLLKTLVSRFYLIKSKDINTETKEAEKFIQMPLQRRIDFIKELLAEPEDADLAVGTPSGAPTAKLDSARSKALSFLNELEFSLYLKLVSKTVFDKGCLEHIFKVREFLRMPGSSPKTLMESVALVVPNL